MNINLVLILALSFNFICLYKVNSLITCKCNDHKKCKSNSFSKNLHCNITGEGSCYSARVVEIIDENQDKISAKIIKRYGCFSSTHKSILSCKGHLIDLKAPLAIKCCNKTKFCNDKLEPLFHYHKTDQDAMRHALAEYLNGQTNESETDNRGKSYIIVIIGISVICGLICLLTIFLILFYRRKIKTHIKRNKLCLNQQSNHNQNRCSQDREFKYPTDTPFVSFHNNGSIMNSAGMTASSLMTNSTSVPTFFATAGTATTNLLVQRRMGHQIVIHDLLGKGRFGEVWSGEWMDQPVTVRLLQTSTASNRAGSLNNCTSGSMLLAEKLWLRTIRLYYSCVLQHSAVLGLLGSDRIEWNGCVRPMLLYPYYSLATLSQLMSASYWEPGADDLEIDKSNQYRSSNTLGRLETLEKMASSIVAGLCYLHTEIVATKGKPSIAHRNLKTSNIYVKGDYSCCIGDLEWALVSSSNTSLQYYHKSSTNLSSATYQFHTATNQTMVAASLGGCATPTGLVQLPAASDFEVYVVPYLMNGGSGRYLAPELLKLLFTNPDLITHHKSVDDYKRADIYSLSLILWEMLQWFEPSFPSGLPEPPKPGYPLDSPIRESCYTPVYQEELAKLKEEQHQKMLDKERTKSEDNHEVDDSSFFLCSHVPNLNEMLEIVVKRKRRPVIPDKYKHTFRTDHPLTPDANSLHSDILSRLYSIIPQCWTQSPDSRINCLHIKKYLLPPPPLPCEYTDLSDQDRDTGDDKLLTGNHVVNK